MKLTEQLQQLRHTRSARRLMEEYPPDWNMQETFEKTYRQYLHETQKFDLSHINRLDVFSGGRYMELDYTARRSLELTESLSSGEKKGSLLWVLDRTGTAMGSRMLRSWVERPLLSVAAIRRRLNAVQELTQNGVVRAELMRALRDRKSTRLNSSH